MPSSFIPSTISCGYSSACSSSVATGRIFESTNWRTVLRISVWMSVSPSVSQRRGMQWSFTRDVGRRIRSYICPYWQEPYIYYQQTCRLSAAWPNRITRMESAPWRRSRCLRRAARTRRYGDGKLSLTTLAMAVAARRPDMLSTPWPGMGSYPHGAGAPDSIVEGHLTQTWLATADATEIVPRTGATTGDAHSAPRLKDMRTFRVTSLGAREVDEARTATMRLTTRCQFTFHAAKCQT